MCFAGKQGQNKNCLQTMLSWIAEPFVCASKGRSKVNVRELAHRVGSTDAGEHRPQNLTDTQTRFPEFHGVGGGDGRSSWVEEEEVEED